MKKQHTTPAMTYGGETPRSRGLIALPRAQRRPGLLATVARLLVLPVRLPLLAVMAAVRGGVWIAMGIGRGIATLGRGLGRGAGALLRGLGHVALAPFKLLGLLGKGLGAAGRGLGLGMAALLRGLAKLVVAPFVLLAKLAVLLGRLLRFLGRAAAWTLKAIVLLPIRAVVLLARLVAIVGRLVGRLLILVLRAPFVLARLLFRGVFAVARGVARGTSAVAVPVLALAWSAVRFLLAGVAAVLMGIVRALAFVGRLLLRGVAALGLGGVSIVVGLARGIFACIRLAFRLVMWVLMLPVLLVRALFRGALGLARLFLEAGRTVATGLTVIVCGAIAVLGYAGSFVGRALRPARTFVVSGQPTRAAVLPLATLGVLAFVQILGAGGSPLFTIGLLLLAGFSFLASFAQPSIPTVLAAWLLSLATAWRAERVGADTSALADVLIYVAALAALRSAYVAARALVRESPTLPRSAEQELAHRRASRAIGIVLAVQCAFFAIWSAASGVSSAPVFGELLLVGVGMMLAWVVRSGQYLRTAQAVLTVGALVALVVTIAAQLTAFGRGHVVTAASAGALTLLLLVAAALTVVVHTRLVDVEHGA